MQVPFSPRTVFLTLAAAAAASNVFGYFPDSTFLSYADSIFALQTDTQVTVRRIKKDQNRHTYFMVTTCKTIRQPFSLVVDKLKQFKSYPDYFTFIMRVAEVEENNATDPATMFLGHYGLYRVYFFGKIREEYAPDSGRYRVFCGDVEQKKYRREWRRRVRGLIKIGSRDVDIFWTVEKRGDTASRVSLTASQSFTTRIPNWMVSIGTNKIFRGMLKDLEKYLAKATGTTAPAAATPDVQPAAAAEPADSTYGQPVPAAPADSSNMDTTTTPAAGTAEPTDGNDGNGTVAGAPEPEAAPEEQQPAASDSTGVEAAP